MTKLRTTVVTSWRANSLSSELLGKLAVPVIGAARTVTSFGRSIAAAMPYRGRANLLVRLFALAAALGWGCPAVAQINCVPPPPGLVGWWAMDNASNATAPEELGRKHADITNTVATAGKVGDSRRFPTNAVFQADGGDVLDISGSELSMAAWIKIESSINGAQRFSANVGKTTYPDHQSYEIAFESGSYVGLPPDQWLFEYVLTSQDGGRVHNQSTGVTVPSDGNFHFVTLTYDGSQVRLFTDGTQRGAFAFFGNLKSDPSEPFRIVGDSAFAIDEVAVWNRALTADGVAALYAAGSAGMCKSTDTPCPGVSIRASCVDVCWATASNKTYQIKYRSSITGDSWLDLGQPVTGNGTTNCITDSIPPGDPQRFYQVVCLDLGGGVTNLVAVNPRATYLNADPGAEEAVPVALSTMGIQPGDRLLLRQTGSFRFATEHENQLQTMVAVFSTSATLLPRGAVRRVPGAVAAGTPFVTAVVDDLFATDIPEDFMLGSALVTVPAGATHLFLSAHDVHYGDNSDPDNDYKLEIVRLPQ